MGFSNNGLHILLTPAVKNSIWVIVLISLEHRLWGQLSLYTEQLPPKEGKLGMSESGNTTQKYEDSA
jgi:hypothetical protein